MTHPSEQAHVSDLTYFWQRDYKKIEGKGMDYEMQQPTPWVRVLWSSLTLVNSIPFRGH